MTAGRWLVSFGPDRTDLPALVCLAPAGGGGGQYRPWQRALDGRYTVHGVALPGRENRWGEPAARSMELVVAAVADEVVRRVPVGAPVVVFGQSFGGLIGFEVVRWLEQVHGRAVAALVVAACRPPHHWVGAGAGMTDDELGDLLDLRGLDDLDDPEMAVERREVMLETLRADVVLSTSYTGSPRDEVAAPLHVWGGDQDEIVTGEQLDGWAGRARGAFVRRAFRGGHDFCETDVSDVLAALRAIRTETPVTDRVLGG
jgi:surfactin synthase thioesterase subunit